MQTPQFLDQTSCENLGYDELEKERPNMEEIETLIDLATLKR